MVLVTGKMRLVFRQHEKSMWPQVTIESCVQYLQPVAIWVKRYAKKSQLSVYNKFCFINNNVAPGLTVLTLLYSRAAKVTKNSPWLRCSSSAARTKNETSFPGMIAFSFLNFLYRKRERFLADGEFLAENVLFQTSKP